MGFCSLLFPFFDSRAIVAINFISHICKFIYRIPRSRITNPWSRILAEEPLISRSRITDHNTKWFGYLKSWGYFKIAFEDNGAVHTLQQCVNQPPSPHLATQCVVTVFECGQFDRWKMAPCILIYSFLIRSKIDYCTEVW